MRAALHWIVLILLLSGAGLLAGGPGTATFTLSALMLGVGVLAGVVVLMVIRRSQRE